MSSILRGSCQECVGGPAGGGGVDQQCLFGLGSMFPVKYMFKEGANEKAEAGKRREAEGEEGGKPGRRKEEREGRERAAY